MSVSPALVPARDIMLAILRDEGATTIFGNPGSTEMPLMDALVDAPDFRYILGLQEATAVGMADGYALKTGNPVFVNLHAAGGIGNAMGVLVASNASQTPMVITAGQQDTRHLFSNPWLAGDLVALAKPVTKWAAEVHRAEDVGVALRRAFAIAATFPQGPVFLSLPMDVLDTAVPNVVPPRSARPVKARGAGTGALAALLAGHDPLKTAILIGDDVPADAAEGAVALAHAGGYAVYGTQVTSRGAYPSLDPCWCGNLKPDFVKIREKLDGMEAVLLIGGRAFVAYPYRDTDPIAEATKFYQIASNHAVIGMDHRVDFAICGDVGASLLALAEHLRPLMAAGAKARVAAMTMAKERRLAETRAAILNNAGELPLSPDAAVLTVLDALPTEAVIANDSAATFGPVQELLASNPGRYFFARGGVLGCAMPAAVGMALAHEGPVACFVGDGGAMYSPQALWSAAHQKAHVLYVVFNNRRYNVLMNVAKDLGYANANAGRFVGMDLNDPPVDYQALARSMGVPSTLANKPADIAEAVRGWAAGTGPMLVEIPIR